MSSDEDYTYDDDVTMMSDEDGYQSSAPSDEEMDMQASIQSLGEGFKVDLKPKRKVYEVDYGTLGPQEVRDANNRDVKHISSIFDLNESITTLLLMHTNWNKERLTEKYMDDPTAVNVAAGIEAGERKESPPASGPSTLKSRLTRTTSSEAQPPKKFVCEVCFDEDQLPSHRELPCGHQFCGSCWQSYITSKIRDEGECLTTCMGDGCRVALPETYIKESVDPDTYERYQELVLRHYVAAQANLKFCPYPSCTQTVSCRVNTKSDLTIVVPTVCCGISDKHKFCFGCPIEGDHRPVICAVAKLWVKKCADDSETANWIKSNTKECSKCQSTIEKNGGCNHMTCKKCKYEFCWVCMGPWSEHGQAWYSCNRFDDSSSVEARDAQAKSRASLERYLHYYNRWANHEQSAKLSLELYAKTEKKMEEMQVTSKLTWIEVQFLRKSLDETLRCRTTLKWTYAMAYYLDKGNQKELFEDNQRDLERAVEELSELIEAPLDPDTISTLRQKVIDRTVYVSNRNEIVLEDTAQGFLDGRWAWNTKVEGFESEP